MAPLIPNRLFEMEYDRSAATQAAMDTAPRSMVGREQLRNPAAARERMGDMLGRYIGPHNAQMAMEVLGWTPADALFSLDDMRRQLRGGRVRDASESASMAVLGALPGGKGAAKGAKAAAAARRAQYATAQPADAAVPTISTVSFGHNSGATRIRPAADPNFDPRFETRVKEQDNIKGMRVMLERDNLREAPPMSIFNLEGKPFVTSFADLSAAGDKIIGIDGMYFNQPVRRLGGQDYMFSSGNAWAMGRNEAEKHIEMAQMLKRKTGQNPVFMPYQMTPTSIDFAHMPRETMLQYAAVNMAPKYQDELVARIKDVIPGFRGLNDPASLGLFKEAVGQKRFELNRIMDSFRDKGGLGLGAARAANTDLTQLGRKETSLLNVAEIDAYGSLGSSGHSSYNTSLPGSGMGRLQETVSAFEFLPDMREKYNLVDPWGFPISSRPGESSPYRSLQMSPRAGIITDKVLRSIDDRLKGMKP